MILPGCLLVLLLPAGGAVLGKWLDGSEGGLWGLAIGFVLGFALAAIGLAAHADEGGVGRRFHGCRAERL
jgi:hypothetical protein